MSAHQARTALATTVLLVAALGAVVAPAAAAGGDGEVGIGIADGEGLNSTVDTAVTGSAAGNGGGLSVDCVGQPTHHSCDKSGEFAGGPLTIDYDGRTFSDDDDLRFGGGDKVTVGVAGTGATVGFDCSFDTSPSADDCAFELPSSPGSLPSFP